MHVLDKLVAAVTPEPSAAERGEAREKAMQLAAGNSPWLTRVLEQHEELEALFETVRSATSADAQRAAQKELAVLLTGHSIAEETVLYPAMALGDQKGHSTAAYTEQSAAKVQIAALETLEPLSEDYLDKLEHLRAAVSHHMYEEESKWFYELASAGDSELQVRLSTRFDEEFERYGSTPAVGSWSAAPGASATSSTPSM